MSAKKKEKSEGGEVSPLVPEVLRVSDLASRVPSERTAVALDTPLEGLPEGWIETTIGQIVNSQKNALVGGPFGSDLVLNDYTVSGIPVIRGQNMGNRFIQGDFVYVSEEKAIKLDANTAKHGDVVFTQRGTLGQVSIVPKSIHAKYVVSQSQMKLTVNRDHVDPFFVYYLFKSVEQQNYIKQNAIQVGVPHTNLGILRNTQINLPPLPQQKKIAAILSSLDDKIELNRAMNETLESIAQALFKSWFVDFDPVRAKAAGKKPVGMDDATAALFPDSFVDSELGPIPKGWEVRSLDELGQFLNGLALQKFPSIEGQEVLPVIKIAELKKGDTINADTASADIDPDYIVDDGDILFSWSGSLFVDVWCGGRGALNQHLFKVTSELYPKWFVLVWINAHLASFQKIAADKAVTMGHIKRSHLTEAKCIVPNSDFIKSACSQFETILKEYERNKLENRNLEVIRDSLLPKLLSGEISVASIGDDAK